MTVNINYGMPTANNQVPFNPYLQAMSWPQQQWRGFNVPGWDANAWTLNPLANRQNGAANTNGPNAWRRYLAQAGQQAGLFGLLNFLRMQKFANPDNEADYYMAALRRQRSAQTADMNNIDILDVPLDIASMDSPNESYIGKMSDLFELRDSTASIAQPETLALLTEPEHEAVSPFNTGFMEI